MKKRKYDKYANTTFLINKYANTIFLIILLISSGIFIYFYNVNQGYWWDEAVYLGLAKNLYEGEGYWVNTIGQETFRPPLFPLLIASVWTVFGFSESLVKMLPPIFGILSIIVLYFFVKRLYDKETAVWASLILATLHFFLFYGEKLLTETIFIFLGLSALYLYYKGIEDDKKWLLPLAGILIALTFLTRYAGSLLMIVYVLYPFLRIKTKKRTFKLFPRGLLKNWGFWLGIILFFAVLIPWFQLNQATFGSPVGAMFTGLGTVTEGYYIGEWYFYFVHWFEIFGLIGIFAIPGIVSLLLKRKNSNMLILLIIILSTIFFMLLPRKETRYLIHFFQIYSIMIAVGLIEFRKWVKSSWFFPLIGVIFVSINLLAGIQMIQNDIPAGKSLKEAGLWLSDRIPEGSTIMSQNVPVLYYTAGRQIIYFPASETELREKVIEDNISFIVIESREPTYPDYIWVIQGDEKYPSSVFDEGFELEKTFEEYNKIYVWVYRVI